MRCGHVRQAAVDSWCSEGVRRRVSAGGIGVDWMVWCDGRHELWCYDRDRRRQVPAPSAHRFVASGRDRDAAVERWV
jgi:hypothetical protein